MAIPEEDLGPGWLRDYQSIEVELDSLRGFAATLQQELERNFRTHLPTVYDSMRPGASLGDSIVGSEIWALRTKYHECISRTVELLVAHDKGTYAMATAAETVATRYGDSDDWAAANANRFDAVLGKPQPGHPTTAGAATSTNGETS